MQAAAVALTTTIELIEVAGCATSDTGLLALASVAPPRLRVVRFSICRPSALAACEFTEASTRVTNAGVEELLRFVGHALIAFYFCYYPLAGSHRSESAPRNLPAETMARSLASNCPNFETFCNKGPVPSGSHRVARERAELTLIELEDAASRCCCCVAMAGCPNFPKLAMDELED
jgi:hypothetical protein